MSEDKEYYLLLKWGTLKGWSVPDDCMQLLRDAVDGSPMSAMLDRPDDARKDAMCKLIDKMSEHGASFSNDWSGDDMTADEAKDYITSYGKE